MKYYKNIDELVGKTPLLELKKIEKKYNLEAKIFAKLEYFNPMGSVKDRIAKQILDDAEEKGLLNKDTVIIEATSGNTGIALAALCAARSYRGIIVMPDSMSIERRKILKAYGITLILTEGKLGMKGSIAKVEELAKEYKNHFIPSQFKNISNLKAHYTTTGPEIYEDMDKNIDIFVAGVGTGGTITGNGKYLKERIPGIKIVAVEPKDSDVLSGGNPGPHKIQGIGAGFVPEILDTSIYDEVISVTNQDAYNRSKELAYIEGVLVGVSSGAILQAAINLAKRKENAGKNIVIIFPDSGERYLSSDLFE